MNRTSKTDAELVKSILNSNQDDFKILMERYQRKIHSYLYRFLYQNEDAALDITQNVFLKVYENLGSYDPKRPIQAWIYRIAHNEAANYLRTISVRKESYLDIAQWNGVPSPEKSDEYEEMENKRLIQKALGKIDAKYREVLVLSYFEERSYKEIADILNISTNTVGTLIRRAKKQMKKTLESLVGKMNWYGQIVFRFFLFTLPVKSHTI